MNYAKILEKYNYIITDNISVPSKKSDYCVAFDNNPITEFVSYTGTSLDIIVGMLFLNQFESIFTSLNKKFITNDELSDYYKVLGIIKEIKGEYMNFEITWLYQKIFLPSNFDSIIQNFLDFFQQFEIVVIRFFRHHKVISESHHVLLIFVVVDMMVPTTVSLNYFYVFGM